MTAFQSISVKQLAALDGPSQVDLIDVRTPAEFREVHAAIAHNVPLDTLDPKSVMDLRNGTASQPLYVICRSGGRSSKGCQKFVDAGYENIVNVEGGTQAWTAEGYPVLRGKKTISLERQVRIVAGFLALLGSLLGYFVHPYFLGISGFVGAGLMFAGVTDSCGMGMMLAKMPWNQCKEDSCSL